MIMFAFHNTDAIISNQLCDACCIRRVADHNTDQAIVLIMLNSASDSETCV